MPPELSSQTRIHGIDSYPGYTIVALFNNAYPSAVKGTVMKRRALLSVIGVTTLAGCSRHLGNDTPPEPTTSPDPNPTDSQTPSATTTVSNESPLKLASHDLVRSNEGSTSELAAVTGTVHNPTEMTVPEATVTALFKNTNGAVLDRASVSASDLSPAQSWSFELVYPGTGEDAQAVADYALTVETVA